MTNPIKKLLQKEPPEILYHYTTQDGLIGILKLPNSNKKTNLNKESSITLWATKIQHLDDCKEFKLATELAEGFLNQIYKNSTEEIQGRIDNALESLTEISDMNIFITSLTQEKDLLSQWQEYADSGRGYSIGFTTEKMNVELKGKQRFQCFLAPVTYNKDEHEKIIHQIIDETIIRPNEVNSAYGIYNPASGFEDSFFSIAPLLKNKSFKEEAEWRLISPIKAVGIELRSAGNRTIAYTNFNFEKLTVSEIIIGPSSGVNLKKTDIETLLQNQNYECKVNESIISSSNW